jgi:anti-sigma factor RsiW
MSEYSCEQVRDLLPELQAHVLERSARQAVEHHLGTCAECAGDLALIRDLAAAGPEPAPGSIDRIRAALDAERAGAAGTERRIDSSPDRPAEVVPIGTDGAGRPGSRGREWTWSLRAAAVLVVALGVTQWMSGTGETPADVDVPTETASLEEDGTTFFGAEDGVIAGGPVLEDLSDDALASVLEDLENWEGSS